MSDRAGNAEIAAGIRGLHSKRKNKTGPFENHRINIEVDIIVFFGKIGKVRRCIRWSVREYRMGWKLQIGAFDRTIVHTHEPRRTNGSWLSEDIIDRKWRGIARLLACSSACVCVCERTAVVQELIWKKTFIVRFYRTGWQRNSLSLCCWEHERWVWEDLVRSFMFATCIDHSFSPTFAKMWWKGWGKVEVPYSHKYAGHEHGR